jgi:hypothetical protein
MDFITISLKCLDQLVVALRNVPGTIDDNDGLFSRRHSLE